MVAARSELAAGDHRLLYLAWLLGIQWDDVDDEEIEPPVPAYDQAASLLRDLSALARRDGDHDSFTARFLQLRSRHERKPSLQGRFDKAGLPRHP
jgi:hypothetical protein